VGAIITRSAWNKKRLVESQVGSGGKKDGVKKRTGSYLLEGMAKRAGVGKHNGNEEGATWRIKGAKKHASKIRQRWGVRMLKIVLVGSDNTKRGNQNRNNEIKDKCGRCAHKKRKCHTRNYGWQNRGRGQGSRGTQKKTE